MLVGRTEGSDGLGFRLSPWDQMPQSRRGQSLLISEPMLTASGPLPMIRSQIWHPNPRDIPAFAAATLAILALIGWFARLPALTAGLPNSPVMKVNAAIAVLALSGACIVAHRTRPGLGATRAVATVLMLAALAIAGATAYEYLTGAPLGIDELLTRDTSGGIGVPGRMGINTIGALVLVAASVAALDWAPRGLHFSEGLGVAVCVVAVLALIGDLYGVTQLAGVGNYTRMAPNTAVALILLVSAVVAAREDHAVFRAVTGTGTSAVFVRRYGLIAMAVPFLVGAAVISAARAGAFGFDYALSLAAFLSMAVGAVGIMSTAVYVQRVEEEGLARREAELFNQLVETASDGIWQIDAQGRTVFMSPRLLKMLGFEIGEVMGKRAEDLVRADLRGKMRSHLESRWTGKSETYETGFVRKDRGTLWALVSATPRYGPDGRLLGAFGLVADITARRQAEEQLRRSELRFRTLFEKAGIGMGLTDLRDRIVEANPALHRTLGYESGELVGMTFAALTYPTHRLPESETTRNSTKAANHDHNVRTQFMRKDGAPVDVRFVMTRLPDARDGWFSLGMVQDLSDELRAEQATRDSEQKSQFLATMSHELRTPLNAILGFAQLLESGDDVVSERQRRFVGNIRTSGEHLLAMVSDVLDFSRVTSGTLPLEIETVAVDEVIAECVAQVQSAADERNIKLFTSTEPLVIVRADRARLHQSLLNLISNALKFTEQGSVTMRTARDGVWVTIEVLDTGIGIAPDQLEAVFTEFHQVDNGLTRRADGAGLGLPLARHLAMRMGGSVEVASEVGVGSVFTLRLPAANG